MAQKDPAGKPLAGGDKAEDEEKRLKKARDEAKEAAGQAEVALAAFQEVKKTRDETGKDVDDYAKELPAFRAKEADLEQFRGAELEFAKKTLPDALRKKIEAVGDKLRKAHVEPLEKQISDDGDDLEKARNNLKAQKEKAEAAEQAVRALTALAASIRARLGAAEAIRAETNKAEEKHDYALAYWLIRNGGKLQATLEDVPKIIEPDQLREELDEAKSRLRDANRKIANYEKQIKDLETGIASNQTKLENERATLEARTREEVSQLNPKTVQEGSNHA